MGGLKALNSVVTTLDQKNELLAGQPVLCTFRVQTVLHGSHSGERCRMRYIIGEGVHSQLDAWLVSGSCHGEFDGEDGTITKITVSVIALRHGELPLPQITVERDDGLVDSPSVRWAVSCETYQEQGAERVTVLPRVAGSTFGISIPLPSRETDHLEDLIT
ncbi:hypothetical protein DL93DRAFT_834392 [Clavulina sp. PMI_390]|nr:hypothetical protein DL93DRAFT_834392 [Clavulina sp. PMI_390]